MRAFLLASATAATFLLRRLSTPLSQLQESGFRLSPVNHRACTADHQGSQVGVSAFADSQQVFLASTGVLSGYQTQPGGHRPTLVKVLGLAYGGHQGTGGDGAYALGNDQPEL